MQTLEAPMLNDASTSASDIYHLYCCDDGTGNVR